MEGVRSSRKGKRKPMAEINVVPYIDVMLVLLIIFMVATPLLVQGVPVELPKAVTAQVDMKEEPMIVSVKEDGTFYINLGENHEKAVSLEDISKKVSIVLRRKPETGVLIWGDTNVPYGQIVKLMASLRSIGATSLGLVTESPEPS